MAAIALNTATGLFLWQQSANGPIYTNDGILPDTEESAIEASASTADLTQYRTKIRSVLGAYINIAAWPVELTDEGLRMALEQLSLLCAPYEFNFTVTAAGSEQIINRSYIQRILNLAWPWAANASFNTLTVNWRRSGSTAVYIEDGVPAVGDKIRVRYQRRFTVNGLDSATATTVPASIDQPLTIGAAAYSVLIRRRILAESPSTPKEIETTLKLLFEDLLKTFVAQVQTVTARNTARK